MLTLIYVAVWCHWVPMISCYPLDPMYYLPNYFYAISTVWLPGSSFLSIWKKDNTGQITYYLFNSIWVLPTFCYSWKLTLICILCCAPCVLCMYPHIILFLLICKWHCLYMLIQWLHSMLLIFSILKLGTWFPSPCGLGPWKVWAYFCGFLPAPDPSHFICWSRSNKHVLSLLTATTVKRRCLLFYTSLVYIKSKFVVYFLAI